ncbi:MALT paracaspase 2 isoform X3 [Nothobranchius furzeri]|uniref:MALT paracaspase 2 n=3 Tax=Nothobranchius TaxID=28779 RepID=A0A1A7ZKQ5_NOTFU|nr:transcript variant X1 [Nothobranchius furzeri]
MRNKLGNNSRNSDLLRESKARMENWTMGVGSLGEEALSKLSKMLDNSACGWRKLASAAAEQPQFRCSEKELTCCSLQVLDPLGSPTRNLLACLDDRRCSLDFLLHCLRKIDHQEAVQFLTTTVSEQFRITVNPQSQQAPAGSKLVLICRASGPPGLNYQWFRGKNEIVGGTGTSPELVLCPLSPTHQGHYICRVNQGEKCLFSQWAQVRLVHSAGSTAGCSSLFTSSVSGLHIVQQPQSQAASEGDALLLKCRAEANPPAQYEWYHNKKPMPKQKTCSLQIQCVTTKHRGEYRCKVFNLYHEAWSDTATVTIGPSSVTEASWVEVDRGLESQEVHKSTSKQGVYPLHQSTSPPSAAMNFYAADKVALLIGNMNYLHHGQLRAPISDVHELTNLLRQMDFKVVSLLDLNFQEMHSAVTEFLLLLDKGVYGLLYYAGHGYENYGNSFLVPIDAPASYTSQHCLCVQNILTKMQEKETGLNVFLLDMCRVRNPNDDVKVQPGLLKVTANIVFGYATCVDAKAYEVNREDVANGIFINFLKQRVCENEKVTIMLDRVAEDMGRCAIARGRQALELRSNLSERRSLTDQIQATDRSASSSARNLQWAVAHVLPESCFLQFDCGVKVQLGFAAEFSNVMVIYTRILQKPREVVSCSAQLTGFPADVDVDLKQSNQETLLEAGSLLLIKEELRCPDVPSLYTRIHSLQRLRRELTFTVCLHYTYSNMDEEVEEKQPVTVGKPLVSKLNLYEPRTPRTCSASLFTSVSSSFVEEFPSVSPTSNTWPYYAESSNIDSLTSSRSANVPEECDSPDLYDAPPSPVSSKSWPHGQMNDANYRFSDMSNFNSY